MNGVRLLLFFLFVFVSSYVFCYSTGDCSTSGKQKTWWKYFHVHIWICGLNCQAPRVIWAGVPGSINHVYFLIFFFPSNPSRLLTCRLRILTEAWDFNFRNFLQWKTLHASFQWIRILHTYILKKEEVNFRFELKGKYHFRV